MTALGIFQSVHSLRKCHCALAVSGKVSTGRMKTFPIAAIATLVLLATCQDAANITTGVPSSDVSADAPPAPTSLSASLLPDSFAIQVSFNHDGTGSPTHWQLLRHELDGSDTVVVEDVAGAGVRAIATTNFDVRGVAYEWLVAACNGAGCSAPSAPVAFSDTLEPPTNLRVTSTASGQVTLEWDDNSALEHKFELHRRGPPGGNANFVLAANRTSFTDRTAQTGVQYYYSVRARIDQADDRCSTWSDEL